MLTATLLSSRIRFWRNWPNRRRKKKSQHKTKRKSDGQYRRKDKYIRVATEEVSNIQLLGIPPPPKKKKKEKEGNERIKCNKISWNWMI